MPYATSSSLRLDWVRRPSDKEFTLEIATLQDNGHGYLPCLLGLMHHYECTNLPRATAFLFRLKAMNESGASPWSPDVYYYTLSDAPGRPGKPQVKGKIHATHFRIKWDPPADCGGARSNSTSHRSVQGRPTSSATWDPTQRPSSSTSVRRPRTKCAWLARVPADSVSSLSRAQ